MTFGISLKLIKTLVKEFNLQNSSFFASFWKTTHCSFWNWKQCTAIPASIYLLKANNRNFRTRCEICLKLTIKTPERRDWCSNVSIVNFEHVIQIIMKLISVIWDCNTLWITELFCWFNKEVQNLLVYIKILRFCHSCVMLWIYSSCILDIHAKFS